MPEGDLQEERVGLDVRILYEVHAGDGCVLHQTAVRPPCREEVDICTETGIFRGKVQVLEKCPHGDESLPSKRVAPRDQPAVVD
jgi:hypothetical protein